MLRHAVAVPCRAVRGRATRVRPATDSVFSLELVALLQSGTDALAHASGLEASGRRGWPVSGGAVCPASARFGCETFSVDRERFWLGHQTQAALGGSELLPVPFPVLQVSRRSEAGAGHSGQGRFCMRTLHGVGG